MATVNVMLRKDAPKKDGSFPIIIKLRNGKSQKIHPIGYSVKENHFIDKEGNWVDGKRNPDAAIINALIIKKVAELNLQIVSEQFNPNHSSESFEPSQTKTEIFYDMIANEQSKYEQRNQVIAWTRTRARLNNLKDAWNDKKVTTAEISKYWVDLYITKRLSLSKSPNTIKKDLSFFSSILSNSNYKLDKDYFKLAQKTIQKMPVNKERLSHLEIEKMEKAILFGNEDLARDIFLFMYYCQGMRIANAIEFKRENIKKDGMIRYQMGKGHKWMEILIRPALQKIIDKYYNAVTPYLFPLLKIDYPAKPKDFSETEMKIKAIDSQSTLIRTWLKRVGYICGISVKISPHIARHTFAQHLKQSGADPFTSQEAMGHSDVRTTQYYMEGLDHSIVNAAAGKAYEHFPNNMQPNQKPIDLNSMSTEDLEKYLKLKKAMDLLLKK